MDAENKRLSEENEALRARVAQLEALVERLTAELEKAQRAGKRQAAPFRKKDGPKAKPKKPGRKSGKDHGKHAHRDALPPDQIDETYEAPLPEACPHCGGKHLEQAHVAVQYQTEIPSRPIYRQFNIHVGHCDDCGRRVQGRHELQTSDALGAAASQLGPRAHAALAICNKEIGASHGKCKRLFAALFGITIARASSVRSMLRTARRCQPAVEEIHAAVRASPEVTADETGWRIGGQNGWLHTLVTPRATCYLIDRSRGADVPAGVLGWDWDGTLVHDGWAPYDRFEKASHQQCLAHLVRRCKDLLASAVGGAVHLPRGVLALVDEAFALRRAHRNGKLSEDDLAEPGLELACRLETLAGGRFTWPPNRRLASHLSRHLMHWFWFLIEPSVEATNWRAEQAIRPAVVNRKVWGGNRTVTGADAQSRLMSVLRSCHQLSRDAMAYFSHTLCSPTPIPLLAPTR